MRKFVFVLFACVLNLALAPSIAAADESALDVPSCVGVRQYYTTENGKLVCKTRSCKAPYERVLRSEVWDDPNDPYRYVCICRPPNVERFINGEYRCVAVPRCTGTCQNQCLTFNETSGSFMYVDCGAALEMIQQPPDQPPPP